MWLKLRKLKIQKIKENEEEWMPKGKQQQLVFKIEIY